MRTTHETSLPPVQALTLDDVDIWKARATAAELGRKAEEDKAEHIDFTIHHLENPLNDAAVHRLGGDALRLSKSLGSELSFQTHEN